MRLHPLSLAPVLYKLMRRSEIQSLPDRAPAFRIKMREERWFIVRAPSPRGSYERLLVFFTKQTITVLRLHFEGWEF